MIDDIIVIAVIVLLVGGALAYIIKAKVDGQRCIGCPDSKTCSGGCSGRCSECSGACSQKENDE